VAIRILKPYEQRVGWLSRAVDHTNKGEAREDPLGTTPKPREAFERSTGPFSPGRLRRALHADEPAEAPGTAFYAACSPCRRAILHARRRSCRKRGRSAFLVAIGPNLFWLMDAGYLPFRYVDGRAKSRRTGTTFSRSAAMDRQPAFLPCADHSRW